MSTGIFIVARQSAVFQELDTRFRPSSCESYRYESHLEEGRTTCYLTDSLLKSRRQHLISVLAAKTDLRKSRT
jgi:hypothetical protein